MEIGDLFGIAMVFVVTGIGISYGLSVLDDVHDDLDANSVEQNATQDAIDATAKFPEKMGLLATVIIAALIIGVLVKYLWQR